VLQAYLEVTHNPVLEHSVTSPIIGANKRAEINCMFISPLPYTYGPLVNVINI
jgi:hypothetical protein